MADMRGGKAASSSTEDKEPQVEVRFVTKMDKYRVTDAPIMLPTRLQRTGLNEVVNLLLELEETPRDFDFIHEGALLRSPLARELEKYGKTGETAVVLEYFEAVPPPQPQSGPGPPHEDWISALAAQPCGSALLTACCNHEAYIWDAAGEQLAALAGHTASVKAVAWLRPRADGLRVATGSKDTCVRTWRVEVAGGAPAAGAVCESVCVGHEASVESLAANPAGDRLAAGAWDGQLLVWDAGEVAAAAANAAAVEPPTPSAKKARGRGKAAAAAAPAAAPVEVEAVGALRGHTQCVSALCWPTAGLLYSAGWDGTVREWTVETLQETATLTRQAAALCLDVSLEGGVIASGHTDHTVRIWDARLQQYAGAHLHAPRVVDSARLASPLAQARSRRRALVLPPQESAARDAAACRLGRWRALVPVQPAPPGVS